MTSKRPRDWTPAATTKLTRLPANGPKPGQSTDAWLWGKTKAAERLIDDPSTKLNDLP
ncbi:hypothetical protein KBZ18_10080 [Synechococcus sp. Cruz-9H2]|uniref:hypothetical protein n=1 Tax=unclassified Synechococcus TaxID=2626047 RepID=UPI0020CDE667|nr:MULTISPECIES: hypothetical protein [unclassified Synechococcus]MCP9819840.1 hypothetical protein [Synechococcus sp. Cruz-9H2]MCP9844094.1 hypothetical protein [Synechococcus sp. Edmonson 11F2]MCP9856270.1 hypothetical protein [Synechococcus sp. Cruz-9C9]MCP9863555.1 hypothetical protein [Synechococcus sp. Cruz-7E5]MCP9870751.1 hypothetical protein [Synechococcus sp. Cruz-7B9]